ncbi:MULTISPECIES: phosphate ABC transporter permease subunit PstC [Isoptericola]|uniref:Phosphate transport system permease protein n=1 Tax=Isoptericola sediminis TaxID=2733572 RepID=A0A849JW06_9MICO|nr:MULTISPECIES: phosphate ABC transporter permease subunit PstC [unclassified Isoptericola]MDO8143884.1 phosphate ABC transporter permease subunit PstC [Isoptericola sp. 178]MDO8149308.1 phosphate ABC transporter permease subunit PstC [Isoptericola sp. b515]MDO8152247.1 phosphate ABC transporter permease subunit PstC [Isoptericola sp. b408]NNU27506.1 phosphate ABC transporter permease subunit PstC [Isoptericola sediminis]
MTTTVSPPAKSSRRRRSGNTDRGFNRVFRWIAVGAGATILAVLAAVALFLISEAWPAITASPEELAAGVPRYPEDTSLLAYLGPLVFGTVLAAVLALVLAVPVAMGIALFISHYAPRRLSQVLGALVDLLAAIPSVIYGLWGFFVLAPVLTPFWTWLNENLGWFPLWGGQVSPTGRSMATVGVVLAIMILPIITAVSREVFLQTPKLHEEAALALGATRWEVIRTAVLPFGRSGVISASMLGLGRALGETMAVLMILSPGFTYTLDILAAGQHQTIAAYIAADFPESTGLGVNTLIAAGLALFVITLAVNMTARWVVARRKDFSGAN